MAFPPLSSAAKSILGAAGVLLVLALILPQTLAIRAVAVLLFILAASALYAAAREQAGAAQIRTTTEKQRRDLENELKQLRGDRQSDVTQEKLSAISRFSSVVSHELKNPLASLKNIAYFLSKAIKDDDPRVRKMLDMMSSELDRTNEMVNELTNLSHIKRISRIPVPVHELITGFVNELKLGDDIHIITDLEEVTAQLDPDKFKLVLTNLFNNARDAMPKGGQVEVRLKKKDAFIEVTVKDTGVGIEKEVLPRIFDPMFTTKTKVLGLGLTVVKEIVGMHNGVIEAESEKDKGAQFKIILPLE